MIDKKGLQYRQGMGNWQAWGDDISSIQEAAIEWKAALDGVEFPWLCWNVNDDWCLLQQRLAEAVGWTPVVGFDPRVGKPRQLSKTAILVDFNQRFSLPVMYPHFPLEFAFLFTERLAFWHSDLLVRLPDLHKHAQHFRDLQQGEMSAVSCVSMRNFLFPKKQRFWELIGCTTKEASQSQYEKGCGWWLHFYDHPNRHVNASDSGLRDHYWDHGSGIMYWKRKHSGKVLALHERSFAEGHFSQIKFDQYQRVSPNNEFRDLQLDLENNFQLKSCAEKLQLESFLGNLDHM